MAWRRRFWATRSPCVLPLPGGPYRSSSRVAPSYEPSNKTLLSVRYVWTILLIDSGALLLGVLVRFVDALPALICIVGVAVSQTDISGKHHLLVRLGTLTCVVIDKLPLVFIRVSSDSTLWTPAVQ